jgi:hypothetical protein
MDPIPLNVFLWVRCSIDIHKLCASHRQGYIATILASHISIVVYAPPNPQHTSNIVLGLKPVLPTIFPQWKNQPKHPLSS